MGKYLFVEELDSWLIHLFKWWGNTASFSVVWWSWHLELTWRAFCAQICCKLVFDLGQVILCLLLVFLHLKPWLWMPFLEERMNIVWAHLNHSFYVAAGATHRLSQFHLIAFCAQDPFASVKAAGPQSVVMQNLKVQKCFILCCCRKLLLLTFIFIELLFLGMNPEENLLIEIEIISEAIAWPYHLCWHGIPSGSRRWNKGDMN